MVLRHRPAQQLADSQLFLSQPAPGLTLAVAPNVLGDSVVPAQHRSGGARRRVGKESNGEELVAFGPRPLTLQVLSKRERRGEE